MAVAPRVVDTSFWIEWLIGSPLGRQLGKELPDRSQCIVPTIVQLELSKWLLREVEEVEAPWSGWAKRSQNRVQFRALPDSRYVSAVFVGRKFC